MHTTTQQLRVRTEPFAVYAGPSQAKQNHPDQVVVR